MAFSVRRFVAWFAVFAALVSAGVIGLVESKHMEHDSARSQSVQATRLASALAVLQRKDSIARALRTAPPRPGLTIVLPAAAAPRDRLAIEAMIRRFWRDAVGESATVPVVVLVPADAGRPPYPNVHPISLDYVLLPSMTDGRTCVIVMGSTMTGAPPTARSLGAAATRMRRHAGACAFLAKYGPPSPAMTSWLASTRWDHARSAITGRDSADVGGRYAWGDTLPPRTSRAAANQYYFEWSYDLALDASHISCLAGNDAMCTPAEIRPNSFGLRGPTWSTALVPSGVIAFPKYWRTQAPEDALLSIVERTIGRDKFAALWTADRPIPDAIRDAAGMPLGGLVKQNLLRNFKPLAATPWPTPAEWLLNLGLIGALIGFVTRTRRHSN